MFCSGAIDNAKSDDLAGLHQGWMSFKIVKNSPVVYFNNTTTIVWRPRGTGLFYYYKSIVARLNTIEKHRVKHCWTIRSVTMTHQKETLHISTLHKIYFKHAHSITHAIAMLFIYIQLTSDGISIAGNPLMNTPRTHS